MRSFVVFSRRGCHLCEEMLEVLEPLCRGKASLVVIDVDSQPDLVEAYGDSVPVLEADGEFVCRYVLDKDKVAALLMSPAS